MSSLFVNILRALTILLLLLRSKGDVYLRPSAEDWFKVGTRSMGEAGHWVEQLLLGSWH